MFSKINTILVTIDAYVWGIPLIVLILSVGLFLTIRLKGVQFTNLGRAFKYIFKDETDGKHGEVSSFAALDRKSTRLNSSHRSQSRMPSSA